MATDNRVVTGASVPAIKQYIDNKFSNMGIDGDLINQVALNTEKLSYLYPVDSIFLTIATTETGLQSPASFFGGTWTRLEEGYALWTASSGAGETIPAGLPNIKGSIQQRISNIEAKSGAFNGSSAVNETSRGFAGGTYFDGTWQGRTTVDFKASNFNSSIYRDDVTTVQPPAYKVYAWRRVA